MKFWVVFLALAVFCRADDDDDDDDNDDESGEVTYSQVSFKSSVSHIQPISIPALNVPLPATVARVKTVPSPVFETVPSPVFKTVSAPALDISTPVAHAGSSTPAVMKIPAPGIKFNIPQTHQVAYQVENTALPFASIPLPAASVPVLPKTSLKAEEPVSPGITLPILTQAVMPKTTLNAAEPAPAIPHTPAATFKATPSAVIPASIPEAMPVTQFKTAQVPVPVSSFLPSTPFQQNIQALPYYTSAINFGSPLPRATGLPSATYQASVDIPDEITVVPAALPIQNAIPVTNTMPVQYASSPNAAAFPAINWPFLGTAAFQEVPVESAQPITTYWTDIESPKELDDFINLSTGGFSYMNVIGDVPSSVMHASHGIPMPTEVDRPFKATQFQIAKEAPLKDEQFTAAPTVSPITSGVIAA